MGVFSVDSVLKYYDNKIILSDVFINLNYNDVLGIFGRNGSGKTTLLKLILGLESCDYIFKKYDSKIINSNMVSKLFSYSPQNSFIPGNFKIKDLLNLFNVCNIDVIKNDKLITNVLYTKFRDLSYGQRSYIQLILVINSNKVICILDEPFSGLSPANIENIVNYIKLNHNKIFIITDHNIHKLFEICNRKIFLKHGKTYDVSNLNIDEIKDLFYL